MKRYNGKYKFLLSCIGLIAGVGCNSGGESGSLGDVNLTTENGDAQVYFSKLGVFPYSEKDHHYTVKLNNLSKGVYKLEKLEISTGNNATSNIVVDDKSKQKCSSLDASSSCQLSLLVKGNSSGNYVLKASLVSVGGFNITTSELIQIAPTKEDKTGVNLPGYAGDMIVAQDKQYSLTLPLGLTENYDEIKVSHGQLACDHGFTAGSSCSWQIDGLSNYEEEVVNNQLEAFRQGQLIATASSNLRVTNKEQAHLLLSNINDILIESTPGNSQSFSIHNSGNITAKDIKIEAFPESYLSITDDNCSSNGLIPGATCTAKVKTKISNATGAGQVKVSYEGQPAASRTSTYGNVLYLAPKLAAELKLIYVSGDNSNFTDGTTRSLIYRLENRGKVEVRDIALAAHTGTITTNSSTTPPCQLDGKLTLAPSSSCSFQANITPMSANPQTITALGSYYDNSGVTPKLQNVITSETGLTVGSVPAITITPTVNWQTMMGSAYAFTATISGGSSTVTPTVTGLTDNTVSPAACVLNSATTASCTFIVTPYNGTGNYSFWNPASIENSTNVNSPANAYAPVTNIRLSVSATNFATINGNASPQTISNISGTVIAPYVYLAAPGEGAASATNTGITWGSDGAVSTRFVAGKDLGGNPCRDDEQIMLDNLTGLTWVKQPTSTGYTFAQANTAPAIPKIYCSYTDWRLPTINELTSLINYSASNPGAWLNAQGFSGIDETADPLYPVVYWSSNRYDDSNAFGAVMRYGISGYDGMGWANRVWPVRGGK